MATRTGDGIASETKREHLTPSQVASQIMADTTLAYWLHCSWVLSLSSESVTNSPHS